MDELEKLLRLDVLDVAEQLLGWSLVSAVGGEETAVTIDETEAYAGDSDPASHAYRGRTGRNSTMFGAAGLLYVYRSYGIHWCMNVVVGEKGLAHAVLLRGGRPTRGVDVMEKRRGRPADLTNGPGKLCQALGVTGDLDGTDLRNGPVRLEPGDGPGEHKIERTPRIGISKATERLWRFVTVG